MGRTMTRPNPRPLAYILTAIAVLALLFLTNHL